MGILIKNLTQTEFSIFFFILRLNQTIKCEAYFMSNYFIELFAISSASIDQKFLLYPTRGDLNGFHDSKLTGIGPWNNTFSFYYSPEKIDDGIRLEDSECAQTMFDLFLDESIQKNIIPVFVGNDGNIEYLEIIGRLKVKWS